MVAPGKKSGGENRQKASGSASGSFKSQPEELNREPVAPEADSNGSELGPQGVNPQNNTEIGNGREPAAPEASAKVAKGGNRLPKGARRVWGDFGLRKSLIIKVALVDVREPFDGKSALLQYRQNRQKGGGESMKEEGRIGNWGWTESNAKTPRYRAGSRNLKN
jgi:hypothetical protein